MSRLQQHFKTLDEAEEAHGISISSYSGTSHVFEGVDVCTTATQTDEECPDPDPVAHIKKCLLACPQPSRKMSLGIFM